MNKLWQAQLQPDVAARYVATTQPSVIHLQQLRRTVDLRTLSLAEADALVKQPGFDYLKARRQRKRTT